jgi:hypothetical protein
MKNLTATICLTIAVLVGSAGVSSAGLFGPSNYDECVLDRMQGVKSDLAARVIIAACSNKFSSKKNRSPSPPKETKYKPELDKYGREVCRVMKELGSWVFVDLVRLSKLKNVTEYFIQDGAGDIVIIVQPSDLPAVDHDKITQYEFNHSMQRACVQYKILQSY